MKLRRASALLLTWTKQRKPFSNSGEITNVELLAGVTGSGKNGYTIKTVRITHTNGTGARVSGSGTSAKITGYTKSGTLTLTLVLQHTAKPDVTLSNAQFEIYLDIFTISSVGEVTLKESIDRKSLTEVIIPNSIEGITVTSIGPSAFRHCTSLTSITIPNSVKSIGDGSFFDCSALTSITIPNSVTSIANQAFAFCVSLTSITIPNSVTTIGSELFGYCSKLTTIQVPNAKVSDWEDNLKKG